MPIVFPTTFQCYIDKNYHSHQSWGQTDGCTSSVWSPDYVPIRPHTKRAYVGSQETIYGRILEVDHTNASLPCCLKCGDHSYSSWIRCHNLPHVLIPGGVRSKIIHGPWIQPFTSRPHCKGCTGLCTMLIVIINCTEQRYTHVWIICVSYICY